MISRINRFMYLLIICIGLSTDLTTFAIKKQTESISKVTQQCPSYKDFYDKDCVFCRIIAGLEPATILYEDNLVIAFEKKPVRSPVSCLIVPKKHIKNCKELDTHDSCNLDIFGHMIEVAQILSKRLNGSGDFKLLINNGPSADQTVFHLHMHFISKDTWAKRNE